METRRGSCRRRGERELGLRPDREISGDVAPERETIQLAASGLDWIKTTNIDGKRVKKVSGIGDVLNVGDVVYVENKGDEMAGSFSRCRSLRRADLDGPEHRPRSRHGRRLLLVQSQFNRATQAYRQPGSSFKPFVYAAALDNGYTPASVVMDAPIQLVSGGQVWEPKNYGGGHAGPSTLRLGIERSRNLMTVRLAKDMGMQLVAEYAERFGVYDDMPPLLAMALGSGETTALRMVSAYSVMANGGRSIEPSLIDRIQDRYGRTIYKHDQRICDGCNASLGGPGRAELIDNREQVLDPMTAYQITSMMEGVVQRGTATVAARSRPPARRQDRHDQRGKGRLVCRLHAEPRDRRLYRLRHAQADGPRRDRRPSRRAGLQGIHGAA
jgi:penicillin-binding protein 1A